MKNILVLGGIAAFVLAASQSVAQTAPQSSRQVLMAKDLPEFAGKEAVTFQITYPPGTSNPPHRHDAHVFIYLLEGELVIQLKGGEPVTLSAGKMYYEAPNDVHVVSRNPSATTAAKAVIFFIKDKGAPVSTPVKQ